MEQTRRLRGARHCEHPLRGGDTEEASGGANCAFYRTSSPECTPNKFSRVGHEAPHGVTCGESASFGGDFPPLYTASVRPDGGSKVARGTFTTPHAETHLVLEQRPHLVDPALPQREENAHGLSQAHNPMTSAHSPTSRRSPAIPAGGTLAGGAPEPPRGRRQAQKFAPTQACGEPTTAVSVLFFSRCEVRCRTRTGACKGCDMEHRSRGGWQGTAGDGESAFVSRSAMLSTGVKSSSL